MNREQLQQLSYDSVMPSLLLHNKNLGANHFRLYAMIRSLAKCEGYCYATNEYLSESLGVSLRALQTYLAALKKEKFIEIHTTKNGISWQRIIRISYEFQKKFTKSKNLHPPMQNSAPILEEYYKYSSSNSASPPLARSEPDPKKPRIKKIFTKSNDVKNDTTFVSTTPESAELAKYLFDKISEFTPGVEICQREASIIFDSMPELKNSVIGIGGIKAAIDYVFETEFWRGAISSPGSFKKNFSKIYAQMKRRSENQKAREKYKQNQSVAKKVIRYFKKAAKSNSFSDEDQTFARKILLNFFIDNQWVFDRKSQDKIRFSLPEEEFLEKLNKTFGIEFKHE